MTVPEEIKVLCVIKNISQAELARRLGTSLQNFNAKLKKGTFSIDDMQRIAEATGVDFSHGFVLENGELI